MKALVLACHWYPTRESTFLERAVAPQTVRDWRRPGHVSGSERMSAAVWKDRASLNRPMGVPMQMRVELIPLPVSDVDRAIAFYVDKLGFKKDFDVQPGDGVRIVQLTPEGSGCSFGFGTGLDVYAGEPGSIRGVHLVVEDITEARAELVRLGVEVGEIQDFGGGVKGANPLIGGSGQRRRHTGRRLAAKRRASRDSSG